MTADPIAARGETRASAALAHCPPLPTLIVVTERTLVPMLWAGLRGHPCCIVAVMPQVRILTGALERLSRWAVRHGLAWPIDHPSAGLPVHDRYPGDSMFLPQHPEVEANLHRLIAVEGGGPVEREYAYALRKALSDYNQATTLLLGIQTWAERHHPDAPLRLRGAPRHLQRLYAWHLNRVPDTQTWSQGGQRAVNALNAILTATSVGLWLLLRIRPHVVATRYRLAVDRISDVDLRVARTVVDNPEDVLIVERSASAAAVAVRQGTQFRTCSRDDARVTPATAARLVGAMVRDLGVLYRRFGSLDSGLFGRLAALAGKRAMFAAFFSRFRPACFWGRDDYSMDHIIRNQELRKIGGRALGINHGLPINTYISQWREIDFDVYYVYGRHLYEHFYRGLWPSRMTVKPVGNIHMTAERRAKLGQPRGNDIAFFAIVTPRFDFVLEQVFAVARRFPDRTVHIRMKGNRDANYRDRAAFWMAQAPENVREHLEPEPYDLMLRVGYSLTAGSTTAAESLQFGAKTFVFDVEPRFRWFYYRNFPGLTVPDGAAVIRRIEAIESGAEIYDFSLYNDLIEMAGPDIYSAIRSDIDMHIAGGPRS